MALVWNPDVSRVFLECSCHCTNISHSSHHAWIVGIHRATERGELTPPIVDFCVDVCDKRKRRLGRRRRHGGAGRDRRRGRHALVGG